MSSDEQQIRKLVADWRSASSSGDIQAVLGLMTDDVQFLLPGREPMRKADFASRAQAQAPGGAGPQKVESTSEIEEIQVSGDLGYMVTRLSVVVTPNNGGQPSRLVGHTLTVLRRVGGRWLLARDANLLAPVEAGRQ